MIDKILIVDGLNYIYHSNHKGAKAMGEYGIIYCFFRSLRALVELHNPDKIFFCLEGRSVFRYKLYAGYKANRLVKLASKPKEEREDFNRQRDIILSLIKYLPVTVVHSDNYEADDCIFSLVDSLRNEDITIVSNDSDLKQILQKGYKHVRIYNPFTKAFVETPKAFVLVVKALAGDTSDNIPGIVGKKKAESLALNPDKLAKLLENEEYRVQFNDNIELIKLRLILEEELVLEDGATNWTMLKTEFENMKFDSLVRSNVWKKFRETFESVKF